MKRLIVILTLIGGVFALGLTAAADTSMNRFNVFPGRTTITAQATTCIGCDRLYTESGPQSSVK